MVAAQLMRGCEERRPGEVGGTEWRVLREKLGKAPIAVD